MLFTENKESECSVCITEMFYQYVRLCVRLCVGIVGGELDFFRSPPKLKLLKPSYFSDILVQPDPGCVIQINFSDCGMSEALENALRLAEGFRRH